MVVMKSRLCILLFVIFTFSLSICCLEVKSKLDVRPQSTHNVEPFPLPFPDTHSLTLQPSIVRSAALPAKLLKRAIEKRNPRWRQHEIEQLIKLRDEDKLPWSDIGAELGRDWQAVKSKYFRVKGTTTTKDSTRIWTADEDKILFEKADAGIPLKEIIKSLEGRTLASARSRYRRLKDGINAPETMRTLFSPKEDERLLKLVAQDMSWEEMAEFFDERDAAQLSNRYQFIRPGPPERRETPQEQRDLIAAMDTDMNWTEIAELLDRSEVYVKKRAKALEKLGLLTRPPHLRYNMAYTADEYEIMHQLREKGVPWNEIANERFPGRDGGSIRSSYWRHMRQLNGEEGGEEE